MKTSQMARRFELARLAGYTIDVVAYAVDRR
jgi:hypothetical protein